MRARFTANETPKGVMPAAISVSRSNRWRSGRWASICLQSIHLHVQMLWRGRDLAGKPLRLSRQLISYDLRAMADAIEELYP